jgi:hypothetical protein
VIQPGDGIGREAREHRSGVAVATSRGRDAGIVSKTEPGEASVRRTAAVSLRDHRRVPTGAQATAGPTVRAPAREHAEHAGPG